MNEATRKLDLWISNDEGLYQQALDAIDGADDPAGCLEALWDDLLDGAFASAHEVIRLVVEDMAAFGTVDWQEIACGLTDEEGADD